MFSTKLLHLDKVSAHFFGRVSWVPWSSTMVTVVWVSSGNTKEEYYWNSCVSRVPVHKQAENFRAVGTPFPHILSHFNPALPMFSTFF